MLLRKIVYLIILIIINYNFLYSNDIQRLKKFEIEIDSINREYFVYIPSGFKENLPVVIMLHGGGGNAKATMLKTKWHKKAEKENFIAVFPEGTKKNMRFKASLFGNAQTWNDGSERKNLSAVRKNVDDIKFIRKIIEELYKKLKINKKRVYVTGFSNGGSMAFFIGKKLSTIVAAIAPVASSDWTDNIEIDRKIPLLYITGDKDPLNPIVGGKIGFCFRNFGNKKPVSVIIDRWKKILDCYDIEEIVYNSNNVKGVAYKSKDGKYRLYYYVIKDLGHVWPGASSYLPEFIVGKSSNSINATDLIWNFFKMQELE